ncbi:MAG: serine--tRNA ligase, partial [Clostridia bacterium]|nr:serine--tRNA ligase [Clostridia bacterium]
MLDLNLIRQNPQFVAEALLKKGHVVDFTELLSWDQAKRAKLQEIEALKAKRNKVSAEIPKLKKAGQPVDGIFQEMRALGDEITAGDKLIAELDGKIFDFITRLPNMPDPDLLAGEKENNAVVKVFGEPRQFDFKMKNHVDLCVENGLIDYERGVKLSGNGFWIYRNLGARLEWALLNFFIDEHLADGYEFILPPHQLGYNCGFGAGQFPKFADEVYWLEGEEDRKKNRFMLPTAETALVSLHRDEILTEADLPRKYISYTPCFRREAGSYRADERGMVRGHQFNKVEMVQYTRPDNSDEAFEELVGKAE